jgi:GNAT superfamily N-acetyltransferase
MPDPRIRIRRGRRTDFTAVMHVLAGADTPLPPPDRATLRRFRNLVADLGGDFYVAAVDETLAGLVHVTYARQLRFLAAARLEQLLVAAPFRGRGVGSALLAFAQQRARRRGCATLACLPPPADVPVRAFLAKRGLIPMGECFVQRLDGEG